MISFAFDLLIRVTVVLMIAMVVGRLLGRRRATMKHRTYSLALTAAVLAPFFMTLFPSIDVLPASQTHEVVSRPPVVLAMGLSMAESGVAAPSETFFVGEPASSWSLKTVLLAVWATGTMLLLSPLLLGRVSLFRLRRHSQVVSTGMIHDVAVKAASDLEMSRRFKLRLSEQSVMPMCWGVLRPTILLPREAVDWSRERLCCVLLHELGHVHRNDLWTDIVAQIARACYWFHPLFWVARRQLVRLREMACDDLVLSTGMNAGCYAEDLLAIADHPHQSVSKFTGISMADRSGLAYRLKTILEPGSFRPVRPTLGGRIGVSLFALSIIVTLMVGRQSVADADEVDTATEKAASPYMVKEDGFHVELIAVGCEQESPSWWTPDGELVSAKPHGEPDISHAGSGQRAMQFVVKMREQNKDDKILMRVPGLSYNSVWSKTIDGEKARIYFVPVPADRETCDLEVMRSTGKWKKKLRIEGRSLGSASNDGVAVVVSPPTGDEKQTTVHASISLRYDEDNHRLVAIDKAGNVHVGSGLNTVSAGGKNRAAISIAMFPGLSIDDYAGVELQTRAFVNYTIGNIALRPMNATDH